MDCSLPVFLLEVADMLPTHLLQGFQTQIELALKEREILLVATCMQSSFLDPGGTFSAGEGWGNGQVKEGRRQPFYHVSFPSQ